MYRVQSFDASTLVCLQIEDLRIAQLRVVPKCIKKAQEMCGEHLDMEGLLQPLAMSVPE